MPGTEEVQPEPDTNTQVMTKTEEDAQVEEIIGQIKQANAEMREVRSENLLQLDSDIKIEPEAKEALGYLVDQFPSEYPVDIKKPAAKVLSQTEKDEVEQKEVINFSQNVINDANEFALKQ